MEAFVQQRVGVFLSLPCFSRTNKGFLICFSSRLPWSLSLLAYIICLFNLYSPGIISMIFKISFTKVSLPGQQHRKFHIKGQTNFKHANKNTFNEPHKHLKKQV